MRTGKRLYRINGKEGGGGWEERESGIWLPVDRVNGMEGTGKGGSTGGEGGDRERRRGRG